MLVYSDDPEEDGTSSFVKKTGWESTGNCNSSFTLE
jgi:hypothetical protein